MTAGTDGARPRDTVEIELVALWSQVLEVPDVGIHDNFFDLGGHSLLAIQLVSRVRRELHASLQPDDLLAAGTVAEMAMLLRADRPASAHHPMVHIRPGGDRPLVALPPVSGTLGLYGQTARHLGPEWDVWGVQSQGLLPGETPLHELRGIAAFDLAAMDRLPVTGPWNLVGYSMGGLLAFELARQLVERGDEVGQIFLLDTRPEVEAAEDGLDFALRALLFRALKVEVDVDWLRALSPAERAAELHRRSVVAGTIPADFEPERLQRMVDIYQHNLTALVGYELRPAELAVELMRVTDRSLEEDEPLPDDLGWPAFARGGVRVHDVPGDHFTMVDPGNAASLAAAINEAADANDSRLADP